MIIYKYSVFNLNQSGSTENLPLCAMATASKVWGGVPIFFLKGARHEQRSGKPNSKFKKTYSPLSGEKLSRLCSELFLFSFPSWASGIREKTSHLHPPLLWCFLQRCFGSGPPAFPFISRLSFRLLILAVLTQYTLEARLLRSKDPDVHPCISYHHLHRVCVCW
jgi:hypothetical protein